MLERALGGVLHRLEQRLAVGAEVGLALDGEELGLGGDLEVEEDALVLELLGARAPASSSACEEAVVGVEPERLDQAGVGGLLVARGGDASARTYLTAVKKSSNEAFARGVRLALRDVRRRRAAARAAERRRERRIATPQSPHWSTAPQSS